MTMITSQIFYQHFLTGLQQNLQSELTDSDQISSGKKISRPSDDPGALWKIVDYQTQLSGIDAYQKAMDSAKAQVQSLDSALSNINTTLDRANELAINAGDGTQDAGTRLMISSEVQQLFNTTLSTANTQVDGRYIFAGFQSNVNPIDPTTGEFISDTNSFNIGIADGINVTANISAGSLFSFKRVNTTDSATGILPTYNWTNGGANTIPDADPTSALQTSSGSFGSSSASFSVNGGSLTVKVGTATQTSAGGFLVKKGTNDTITIDGSSYSIANGADPAGTSYCYNGAGLASRLSTLVAGVTFTYNATNHSFNIAGAGHTVTLSASTIRNLLGFNSAGVQNLTGTGISSDNNTAGATVGDVNLAAGSTLQDVRDAINVSFAGSTASNPGIKAQVVNMGSSSTPDYRIVIASNPVGSSSQIDIATNTIDAAGAGVNMLSYDKTTGSNMTLGADKITNYNYIQQGTANDSIVIDDGRNGGVANNQIVFQENGGANLTAKIARGTYTESQLATALASALTTASGTYTYSASYDSNTNKFLFTNNAGAGITFKFLWSNASSTATPVLGNNAADATYVSTANGGTGGGSGITVASNNPVLDNYYSFNNNYLNDNNILRALNFENESLKNNDSGRISMSLKYMGDLTNAVSQSRAVVGARENEIAMEASYQTNTSTNIQSFMSNIQDTDFAKVTSDLTQRQATLSALRTISAKVLNETLFDFLKF